MTIYSIILCSLIALSSAQYQKQSKDAAILSEARYLAVNGQFGASYKQEDGVEFKEESDGQGNRRGSYSYVDPSGVRRTVTYTAGKEGFRATGDHIPVPPVVPAAPVPSTSAPNEQYDSNADYDDSQSKNYQGQYNYNDFQFLSQNALPAQPQTQYNSPVPQYNPSLPQYNSIPSPHNPISPPQYNPLQFQYQSASASVPSVPSIPAYNQFTTEPSHRFLQPGKLSLNRSPEGFSYTFNKI
ncbi:hypothetical protein PGB90_001931 [Kerria lacca]